MENNLELLHAKNMLSDYKKYGITENELAELLQINLFTLRKIKERKNLQHEKWLYVYKLATLFENYKKSENIKMQPFRENFNYNQDIRSAKQLFDQNWAIKDLAKYLHVPYNTLTSYSKKTDVIFQLPWIIVQKMALLNTVISDINQYKEKKISEYEQKI